MEFTILTIINSIVHAQHNSFALQFHFWAFFIIIFPKFLARSNYLVMFNREKMPNNHWIQLPTVSVCVQQ